MRRCTDGFSLIEAVVVIAIMAILAGAAAPLLVKAVDQQRITTTQANLQIAWQAMFGTPGSRVQNMRADFGFDPGGLADLGMMLNANAPPGPNPLAYGQHGAIPFNYGWNGPYWNGSVATNAAGWSVPVDGWGRPIQLLHVAGSTAWQMVSFGQDGVPGNPDNLYYPSQAVNLGSAYVGTVYFNINNQRPAGADVPVGGTYLCQDRSALLLKATATPIGALKAGASVTPAPSFNVLPGPVSINVFIPGYSAGLATYNQTNFSEIIDVLPGQPQVVNILLN